jgi:cell division protein FtsW
MSCIAVWIVGQAFINILVVLQVLPVIGLPLPFVSSGGTALIVSLVSIGICVRMAREQTDIARVTGRHHKRSKRSVQSKGRA